MKQEDIQLPNPLSKEDIRRIVYGACFYASGGGGPLDMAERVLNKIEQDVYYIDTDKLETGKKGFVVCNIGSPESARRDPGLGDEAPINAYRSLKEHLEKEGDTVSYLMPIELGAVNTLVPFYIASKIKENLNQDIQVINADPAGRSVPTIGMVLLNRGGTAICPAAVASDNRSEHEVYTGLDPQNLGIKASEFIKNHKEVGGLACYPNDGADLNSSDPKNINRLIQGSIGLVWKIGDLILGGKSLKEVLSLLESLGIKCFTLIENAALLYGLDVGRVKLVNETDELWIYYLNESLLAWNPKTKRPVAMGPDGITFVLEEPDSGYPAGTPISNAGFNINVRYTVVGIQAFPKIRNDQIINVFLEHTSNVLKDYPDDDVHIDRYIPIEELNS